MKKTIRPDGRNHSIPKGMFEFFRDLESLAGVEAVNSGKFIPRNKVNGFEAKIQYYDEIRRTFRVRVGCRGFISYFEMRVSPGAKKKIEDYIRDYKVNGFASKNLQGALQDVSQNVLQEACYGLNPTSMVGV
ncbi:MAG: hypothetical protein Q8N99_00760 [Nanoarchaeota archaeon]|nr:hypothetical protein [Nanoarchaeota archaeon]